MPIATNLLMVRRAEEIHRNGRNKPGEKKETKMLARNNTWWRARGSNADDREEKSKRRRNSGELSIWDPERKRRVTAARAIVYREKKRSLEKLLSSNKFGTFERTETER